MNASVVDMTRAAARRGPSSCLHRPTYFFSRMTRNSFSIKSDVAVWKVKTMLSTPLGDHVTRGDERVDGDYNTFVLHVYVTGGLYSDGDALL